MWLHISEAFYHFVSMSAHTSLLVTVCTALCKQAFPAGLLVVDSPRKGRTTQENCMKAVRTVSLLSTSASQRALQKSLVLSASLR